MKLPAPPPRRDRVLYAAAAVVLSYPDDETLGRLPLADAIDLIDEQDGGR